MNYDRARQLWASLEADPDSYVADLGTAQSGVHGGVMAMAKQLVVTGEASDLADAVGKVLADHPGLYDMMLRDGR
jgi:hypothetical protein